MKTTVLLTVLSALLLSGCFGAHMGWGGHHGAEDRPHREVWRQGPPDGPCPEGAREGRPYRCES